MAEGSKKFIPADDFDGAKPGMCFKMGPEGLGYYDDPAQTMLPKVRPQLPERWRQANLRETRLKVRPGGGAGLELEHSEFGFLVEGVGEDPGQDVEAGEVVVALDGRLLVGLSEGQMQASFLKRCVDGAKLQLAWLEEVKHLNTLDPHIMECWDAKNKRSYFFHKKTGKSGWTREELMEDAAKAQEEAAAAPEKQAAPIDIANFLSRGFSKEQEPPAKKLKAAKAKAKKMDDAKKTAEDESDRARSERERWSNWNEGGRGGYTDMFFAKYKNCQSNPDKPKPDKRLKGSVGPGQGMEYMAAWTGSKNSFN